jgi:hypothetical protein
MTQQLSALTAIAIAAITAVGASHSATTDFAEDDEWVVLSPTPLKKSQSQESGVEGMGLEEETFLSARSKSSSPGTHSFSSASLSPEGSPPTQKRFTAQEMAIWHQLVQDFTASQLKIAGILSKLEEISAQKLPMR